MTALDETFRAQRHALRDQTVAQATAIWQADYQDRNRYLGKVLTLVEGAQRAMVTLTSAYLTAKAREIGQARVQSLNLADYTVAKLRDTPAVQVYARPYGALYGQLSQGADKATAHASALDALSKLAATDVHMAYTASAADWMGKDKAISAFKRVPSGTCDYCEAAAEGLYHPSVQMPIHENCVIGETLVAVTPTGERAEGGGFAGRESPVREVTRRWYRGEIVRLRTAGGNELAVTPNHPILTAQGWVAAGLLDKGDHVLSRSDGERIVGRVPDEYEVPARIEDVFAAGRVRGFVSVPFSAENFHGDRGDGEVDVVSVDRELWHRLKVGEPAVEETFAFGGEPGVALAGSRSLAESVLVGGLAAHGGVSGGGARFALVGVHALHRESLDGAPGTAWYPGSVEVLSNGEAADPERLCEFHRAFPVEVSPHELAPIDGATAAGHSALTEMPNKRRLADANSGRDLIESLAGLIASDRIIELRRVDWSGHVYNLHTRDGFYLANGVVTHNCECDLEPVFGKAAVAATGLSFHSGDSGAVSGRDAGDLEARLDTTGPVPAPPRKRRRRERT